MGLVTLAIVLFVGYSAWRLLIDDDPVRRKKYLNSMLGYAATIVLAYVAFRSGLPWLMGVILAAFLLSRVGALKQKHAESARPATAQTPKGMTRGKALQILGLEEGATPEEINERYRELMKRVHPDRGGSTYLATELNEAKRVLLGR